LLYAKIREWGKGKKYDVLLGLSGGVDSSLCLHFLVKNGIRPLTYSIDNGWNDPKADENIMRMVEKLKVPFYRQTIDLKEFRELQSAFLKSGTKNQEIPTDHILMASTYAMAEKYGIKYVISGGNLATESIMPRSWGYQAKDLTFIKAIYRRFTGKTFKNIPMISLPKYLYFRFVKGIEIINLLDYYDYNREGAKRLLESEYEWKDYGEKHCESTFTWWFQNFYLFTKWDIDKRRAHYSSLILSGQMTRQEALDKLTESPIYPELGIEKKALSYSKHDYKEFKNSEWVWNLMSRIYSKIK